MHFRCRRRRLRFDSQKNQGDPNRVGQKQMSNLHPDRRQEKHIDRARAIGVGSALESAGGNLVLIPGADPLPKGGPLLDALPCDIGVNQDQAAGLNGRGL